MYQLIYFLCAHPETGVPCQRFLRTSHDFFVTHASNLPFVRSHLLEDGNSELFVLLSNQQSWLLKTLALEVKMASHTRLRSSVARILDVLYGNQSTKANDFTGSITGMCYIVRLIIYICLVTIRIIIIIIIIIIMIILILIIILSFPFRPRRDVELTLGSVFACHLFKRGTRQRCSVRHWAWFSLKGPG